MDIVSQAKKNYERMNWKSEFPISEWWIKIREIFEKHFDDIKTAEDAIEMAQCSPAFAFDNRLPKDGEDQREIILAKCRYLKEKFLPNFMDMDGLQEHRTSGYLWNVNGKLYSNPFLTHLYYAFRINSFNQRMRSTDTLCDARILELGAGYGGLCRIYKTLGVRRYVVIDIPTSLFFAECYLGKTLDGVSVGCGPDGLDKDITLISTGEVDCLLGCKFDVFINTGSFQEMKQEAVDGWMRLIETRIFADSLYSMNYGLCNKKNLSETSGVEANLICPTFDDKWIIKAFEINPLIMMIDCYSRNWLEIYAEREETPTAAAVWYEKAKNMEAVQDKMALLWNAVWKSDVTTEIYSEMLDIIKRFGTYRIPNETDRLFDGDFACFGEYVYFYNKKMGL